MSADKQAAQAVVPGDLATAGAVPTRYKLIAVTFSLSMLLYIDRVAISTARNPVSEAFGLTDTQFGWVLSAFALGYALFQTPAGALADRYGARIVLAAVVGLWSVFTALTGIAWSFASLLLFRFLFGAAEAGAYPTCARAFYAWLPAGERGLAQGINFSGSRLGAAFALPAVAWLVMAAGWRRAFLMLGAFGIVWAAAWYAWFRNTPDEHGGVSEAELQLIQRGRPASASAAPAAIGLGALVRSANMRLAMGQYFASNFTFFFCLTWLFPYLQRTYRLEALQTGLLAALPLVGGAIGNWVGGAIVDSLYRRGRWRESRQYAAIAGFVLSAAGLLASLAFQTPLPAVLCLTIAMLGSDMTLPPSWAFCIDIGRANAGTVSGTMNMAGNIGSFVTSLAFPYLLAMTGSTTPFFVLGAVLNLMAAWLWTRARPDVPVVAMSAGD
jgi:ACS family glucarate transporter-like MFS transporter